MMFAYFNIFDFFSRYTFKSHYSNFGYGYQPDISQTPAQISTDPVTIENPEAEQPIPAEEPSEDTIEISGRTPETNEKSPVYTPKDIVPAEDSPEEIESGDDKPVEKAAVPQEIEEELSPFWSKSKVKLNLNMAFSLSRFDAIVSSLAEDAEDGQINSLSYSDLNIGLRAELNARARVKEMYKDMEGPEDPHHFLKATNRLKSRRFDSAMMRSRGFEADMFYRESLKTSSKIRESYRHGFLKVSRKLHVRYTQDFGLNIRALNMFNGQSEALDKTGDLNAYLNNTESLVDSPKTSGAMLESFFDMVQEYLDGAEDQLLDKINLFFENLASEMGVDTASLQNAQEIMVSNVADFFDRVDSAVELSRDRYLPASEEIPVPEIPEIPEEPIEEPIVETVEADAIT